LLESDSFYVILSFEGGDIVYCIISPSDDPYFNMAADEYILKDFSRECFMLYKNRNAVIIGRHQNTLSEINSDYVNRHGVSVVRRSSGGGAVYHDMGNLNFTFAATDSTGRKDIDFRRFTEPIISLLRSLGVNAAFQGRNDLTIDGKKFSGNAGYRAGERVLSHGTLLFDADLEQAARILNVDPEKFSDKTVKSVRSRITNIREHLASDMTMDDFEKRLIKHVLSKYDDAAEYFFNSDDIKRINELKRSKYATWEWNFGKTVRYGFKKTQRTAGGTITAEMTVKRGIITAIAFSGDYFGNADSGGLSASLTGVRHHPEDVRSVLKTVTLEDYMVNVTAEDIIFLLF